MALDSQGALLHSRNAKLLVTLKISEKRWYAGALVKETGLSYVYVSKLIAVFSREGLIEVKREGRIRRVTLTENGARAAQLLDELASRLSLQEKK